jgi:hypothetical protein
MELIYTVFLPHRSNKARKGTDLRAKEDFFHLIGKEVGHLKVLVWSVHQALSEFKPAKPFAMA